MRPLFGRIDDPTWDHVFPESWYTDTTPADLEKWEVPACEPCNKGYGRVEERLLSHFALCLDPNSLLAGGIPQKMLRATDVKAARDKRDARHRAGKFEKIHSGVYRVAEIPKEGILPGFGPQPNLEYQEYFGVLTSQDDLRAIILKFVRGFAFNKLERLYLDRNLEIHCYPFEGDGEVQLNNMLEQRGTRYEWGKGIMASRVIDPRDPTESVARVELWGRWRFYLIVRRSVGTGITFHGL